MYMNLAVQRCSIPDEDGTCVKTFVVDLDGAVVAVLIGVVDVVETVLGSRVEVAVLDLGLVEGGRVTVVVCCTCVVKGVLDVL